jgi:acetyl-CoA carboxylase biotin carboxyl carrier protein
VSDGLSSLKEEDVQRLARLIESLESSTFDYLQLQVGDLKVTIGKGAVPLNVPVAGTPNVSAVAVPDASPRAPAHAPPQPGHPQAPGKRSDSAAPTDTIDIKAQIMGMFYSQPEPGSPPYVSHGTEVKADTTVCLIEVMKTFNAMTAGVNGVITEICVKNAQLVEYGQVLFRIRPS